MKPRQTYEFIFQGRLYDEIEVMTLKQKMKLLFTLWTSIQISIEIVSLFFNFKPESISPL